MAIDPITLIMFGLIAVLIFFMFRNGKKRQQAMAELQRNLRPGAEVMLQSGIFATIEDFDEEANKVTVRSGTSTLVVHRNAIGQVVTPVEVVDEVETELAADDDPAFGERFGDSSATNSGDSATGLENPGTDSARESGEGDKPKA